MSYICFFGFQCPVFFCWGVFVFISGIWLKRPPWLNPNRQRSNPPRRSFIHSSGNVLSIRLGQTRWVRLGWEGAKVPVPYGWCGCPTKYENPFESCEKSQSKGYESWSRQNCPLSGLSNICAAISGGWYFFVGRMYRFFDCHDDGGSEWFWKRMAQREALTQSIQ